MCVRAFFFWNFGCCRIAIAHMYMTGVLITNEERPHCLLTHLYSINVFQSCTIHCCCCCFFFLLSLKCKIQIVNMNSASLFRLCHSRNIWSRQRKNRITHINVWNVWRLRAEVNHTRFIFLSFFVFNERDIFHG